MINYVNSIKDLENFSLAGFFVGWPNPPSEEVHLSLLKKSAYIWLADDHAKKKIIGFVNAISDETLSAYIPLLEVLPEYKNQEIGIDTPHE